MTQSAKTRENKPVRAPAGRNKARGGFKLVSGSSRSIESEMEMDSLIDQGVPLALVHTHEHLVHAMIASGVLPRKTWESAQASKSGRLTPANSERFIRVLRASSHAGEVFGDAGDEWLQTPTSVFGGKTPMAMLKSEAGGRAVELLIMRAMHGFAA